MQSIMSHSQAKAAGVKSYFTGKPCKYGHVARRTTCSGSCMECNRLRHKVWVRKRLKHCAEYSRAWRLANLEKFKAHRRKNHWKVADKNKLRSREHYAKNKLWLAEYRRAWAAQNPDKELVYMRNKRARRVGNGGKHTAQDIIDLLRVQGGKCAHCACEITKTNQTVDHIIPSFFGGRNDKSNLQILCRPCNSSKGINDHDQWVRSRAATHVP